MDAVSRVSQATTPHVETVQKRGFWSSFSCANLFKGLASQAQEPPKALTASVSVIDQGQKTNEVKWEVSSDGEQAQRNEKMTQEIHGPNVPTFTYAQAVKMPAK